MKKKKENYSNWFEPFATLDNRVGLFYLTGSEKIGYQIGIVVDGKKTWDVSISPKGNKVWVTRVS